MGQASTNNTTLSFAIEVTQGVPGTEWKLLQPNSIDSFSANISTAERNPISKNRQREKGVIIDLESNPSFGADLTMDSFRDFLEGFMFSVSDNGDIMDLKVSAANTTTDTYTIETLSSSQQGRLKSGSLVYVSGFVNNANNGIKTIVSSTATTITVAENLITETASARISFAGARYSAGHSLTWTWDAVNKRATLADTGVGTELAALGLQVNQLVHVGSVTAIDQPYQNGFQSSAANDMVGYARVSSITANAVVFSQVDAALQFTDATAPITAVDILFSEFVQNVPVDNSKFLQRSYSMEAAFDNLSATNETHYVYSVGNYANELTINVDLTSLSTLSYGFIGEDTALPVKVADRKIGANTPKLPSKTAGFSSQSDFARLIITDVDDEGLTTFFTNMSVTINNNVNPVKVLNKLGSQFVVPGNLNVDIDTEVVFTEPKVLEVIRTNERVKFDLIMRNTDGVFSIYIPSMTLGGGDLQLPENDVVRLAVQGQAYRDEVFNISMAVSIIAVPLPQTA